MMDPMDPYASALQDDDKHNDQALYIQSNFSNESKTESKIPVDECSNDFKALNTTTIENVSFGGRSDKINENNKILSVSQTSTLLPAVLPDNLTAISTATATAIETLENDEKEVLDNSNISHDAESGASNAPSKKDGIIHNDADSKTHILNHESKSTSQSDNVNDSNDGYESSSSSSSSSYSSSSSSSSDDDNGYFSDHRKAKNKIQHAIDFLTHSSIQDLSYSEKIDYLKSKGLTRREIKSAISRIGINLNSNGVRDDDLYKVDKRKHRRKKKYKKQPKNRKKSRTRSHRKNHQKSKATLNPDEDPTRPSYKQHSYSHPPTYEHPYQSNHHDNPNYSHDDDLDETFLDRSPIPAATLGGMVAVTALAAFRWLNGGDFVLFPPPQTRAAPPASSMNKTNVDASEPMTEEPFAPSETAIETIVETDEEEIEQIEEEEDVYEHENDEDDADANFDPQNDNENRYIVNHEHSFAHTTINEKGPSDTQLLADEIRDLSKSVKDLRLYHEKKESRVASANLTNSAMTLLQQSSSDASTNTKHLSQKESHEETSIHVAIQLAETKAELSTIKQLLLVYQGKEESSKNMKEILENIDQSMQTIATKLDQLGSNKINVTNDVNNSVQDATPPQTNSPTASQTSKPSSETPPSSAMNKKSAVIEEEEEEINKEKVQITLPSLAQALRKIQSENDDTTLKAGAPMLRLYTLNLSKNPLAPRYRKIFTSNASFQNKVGKLVGGIDLLRAVGFVQEANLLEWKPETIQREKEEIAISQDNEDDMDKDSKNMNATKLDHATKIMKEAANGIEMILSNPNVTFFSTSESQDPSHTQPASVVTDVDSSASFQTPNTKDNLLISPPAKKRSDYMMNFVSDATTPLRAVNKDSVSNSVNTDSEKEVMDMNGLNHDHNAQKINDSSCISDTSPNMKSLKGQLFDKNESLLEETINIAQDTSQINHDSGIPNIVNQKVDED